MRGKISIEDLLPDGQMIGLDAWGHFIVCLEYAPNYKYLFGTPEKLDDVAEWMVNTEHARRIAMIGAWRGTGYDCAGRA